MPLSYPDIGNAAAVVLLSISFFARRDDSAILVGQASTPAAGLQTRSRFMFAACRYAGQTSRSGCPLGRVLQDPLFARRNLPYRCAHRPAWTPAAGLESCPT
jgi:hypothetical protein